MAQARDRVAETLNWIVIGILAFLLFAAPWAMGAVADWSRALCLVLLLLAASVWLAGEVRRGRIRLVRTWLWLPLAAILLLQSLQLVPLPPAVIGLLSPETLASYERLAPEVLDGWVTLSLYPHASAMALACTAGLMLCFFLVVHTVRTPRHAAPLIGALLAAGVLQCLYGLQQTASGAPHVFWYARTVHLKAVTGSYLNKNHLAQFLGMLIPLTLVSALSLVNRARQESRSTRGLPDLLSKRSAVLSMVLLGFLVVLTIGLCGTLSRGGILSVAVAAVALLVGLGLLCGLRRATIGLSALVFCLLGALAVGSLHTVAKRLEDALSGRSATWADRVDLMASGFDQLRDFPLFGTGGGSFRFAFERYQSGRFGDRIAEYLHNDWLQIACEYGLPALVLVVAAAAVYFAVCVRHLRRHPHALARHLGLGALAGVAVMLIHSFFDAGILRLMANGLTFAAIAALAFAARQWPEVGAEEANRIPAFRIPTGSPRLRPILLVLGVGLPLALMVWPLRRAVVDIELHRCLAQAEPREVNPTFCLPVHRWPVKDPLGRLHRLAALDPSDPRVDWALALHARRLRDKLAQSRARKRAQQMLGHTVDDSRVTALAVALEQQQSLTPEPLSERFESGAANNLRRAISKCPIAAPYHVELMWTLRKQSYTGALPCAARAVWLAPCRPRLRLNTGRFRLLAAGKKCDESDAVRAAAVADLRAAVRFSPVSAGEVYPLAAAVLGPDGPRQVTPETFAARKELAQWLWREGRWRLLLTCLEAMSRLNDSRVAVTELRPWTMRPDTPARANHGQSLDLDHQHRRHLTVKERQQRRLWIAARRLEVLALLQEQPACNQAFTDYREQLRSAHLDELRQAEALARRGRHPEAADLCRRLLRRDHAWPEALLLAAECAHAEGRPSIPPHWESAGDYLFRLVTTNDELPPAAYQRVCRLANQSDRTGKHVTMEFALGAAALLAGHSEEGADILEALIAQPGDEVRYWRQRHLLWYYLGLARRARNDDQGARKAFLKAHALVPHHRGTLQQLVALNAAPEWREKLQMLTSNVHCRVDFGGRLRFLGYSIRPASTSDPMIEITIHWELRDRTYSGYRPHLQLCDGDWRPCFSTGSRFVGPHAQPYPLDLARCGEVLIQRWRLPAEAAELPYLTLTVGSWSAQPPKSLPVALPWAESKNKLKLRLAPPEPTLTATRQDSPIRVHCSQPIRLERTSVPGGTALVTPQTQDDRLNRP